MLLLHDCVMQTFLLTHLAGMVMLVHWLPRKPCQNQTVHNICTSK